MTSLREGAICASLMLGLSTALLTFGFWLRHGQWIWEAMI